MPKATPKFYVRYSTAERCPVLGWKPDTRQTETVGPFNQWVVERKTTLIMDRRDVLPGSVEVIEK